MGLYNDSNMKTILDEEFAEMDAHTPVVTIFQKITGALLYSQVTNLCPSFINASYPGTTDAIGSFNNCTIGVDEDSESDDDPVSFLGGGPHLKTNEVVWLPNMLLCPPPRCNVIFPSQYTSIEESINFTKKPTRGIMNVTGGGELDLEAITDNEEALIIPDSIKDGLEEDEHYLDPGEYVSGQTWSTFFTDKPESAEELGSDYMKGYMTMLYHLKRFDGNSVKLSGCAFNPKPMVGLPVLIICVDGNHLIADLVGLKHTLSQQGVTTSYQFGAVRRYDDPVPSSAANLWYDHGAYSQENVGAYIYPKIVGQYFEGGAEGMIDEENPDRSIMVHVFKEILT